MLLFYFLREIVPKRRLPGDEESRVDALVLRLFQQGLDGPGPDSPSFPGQVLQAGLDHAQLVGLVVDDEIAPIPQSFDVLAQDSGTRRVKGAHPDSRLFRAEELLHAKTHFLGSLVGEGDGQDAPGRNLAVQDQVGHAIGQHPRLAASRSGKDEQGPSLVENRFFLAGVKRLIQIHACGGRFTRR